ARGSYFCVYLVRMIGVQNENNRQPEVTQPLRQSGINAGWQNHWLTCVYPQPAHMWDPLKCIGQSSEPRIAQREWVSAAQNDLFYGTVIGYLAERFAPPRGIA